MKLFNKRNIIATAALAMLMGCGNLPENTFKIDGIADNYTNDYIYLTTGMSNGNQTVDSCKISNGKFTFTGNITEPMSAVLSDKKPEMFINREIKYIQIYIEPAKMSLKADWNSEFDPQNRIFMTYTLTGSKTNDESIELDSLMKSDTNRAYEHRFDAVTNFMKNRPDSYISAYYLSIYGSMLPLETVESLYNGLTERAKNFTVSAEIVKQIELIKSVQPGKPAPEFATVDMNGNPVKLSDFRGKTVLLDFWASWCKPCRASMPHVKELYKKYKNKGLVVICVGDNDSNPDTWKAAIEQDGIGEFVHVLRGLKTLENGGYDKSEDISEGYDVHTIPSKFIIDADGNFVSCKADDTELDAKLKEIYGF